MMTLMMTCCSLMTNPEVVAAHLCTHIEKEARFKLGKYYSQYYRESGYKQNTEKMGKKLITQKVASRLLFFLYFYSCKLFYNHAKSREIPSASINFPSLSL